VRPVVIAASALIAASLTIPLVSAGGQPPASRPDKGHDFGDKIIYLVTKPKDPKSECGYGLYEKVKVIHLADRAFLVGQVPDCGEENEAFKEAFGKTVWTPISEIVQLSEFSTVAEAKRYFASARREGDKPDR
jgi:hypothetical protein